MSLIFCRHDSNCYSGRMSYFRDMDILQVSGLSKKEKGNYTVKDISFTQQAFQKIAIAGETGSGKTTLLRMIAGLLQADAGEIWFEQKKMRGPDYQLIPGHAGMAYLSQHFELRNNYRVHEILSYANQLTDTAAATLYTVCRINHLLQRRTDQLSGGEKQRIALARLLIGSPRLLLLDEPFSNLDATHRSIIKSVIEDISTRLGISCIMVSHDAPDMLPWADMVLILKDGQMVQQGNPETVYFQPADEYCAGLFGEYNIMNETDAAKLEPEAAAARPQQKMLVRPQQFGIQQGSGGLQAIIKQVSFMGSYYTTEADTGRQLIKIRTVNNTFTNGSTVQVTLQAGAAWI